jgi:hypothetical protein
MAETWRQLANEAALRLRAREQRPQHKEQDARHHGHVVAGAVLRALRVASYAGNPARSVSSASPRRGWEANGKQRPGDLAAELAARAAASSGWPQRRLYWKP